MAMRKILVADDSLTIQKVIRLALSQEGYEIETLGDGNSLLQRLPVFRPDIVLIDISLPGKSAFDARRDSLKNADLSNTRWVLMSSAFDQVNDQQVQELKFHGRLIKPFDPTYLRKVLLEASSAGNSPAAQPPTPPSAAPSAPGTPPPRFRGGAMIPADPPPPVAPTFPAGPHGTGLIEMDDPTFGKDLWQETMGLNPSPFAPVEKKTEPKKEIRPASPLTPVDAPPADDDVIKLTQSTVRMSGLDHYQWNVHEPATEQLAPLTAAPSPAPEPVGLEPEAPTPSPVAAPALGSEQLEQLVQREISSQIQRIVREVLPDIAERVLKEEIHKMLSNPPNLG